MCIGSLYDKVSFKIDCFCRSLALFQPQAVLIFNRIKNFSVKESDVAAVGVWCLDSVGFIVVAPN